MITEKIYNDRSSMYNMMEFWMKYITPKYFDTKDLSLSRIGLFGYMNEICSNSFEDIVNENSIMYNEIFRDRAILPETILTNASQYNITDINAKPSTMTFDLAIREDILLKNVVKEGSNTFFVIDRDSEIIVEDNIKFMLDYNIRVNVKQVNNKYVYTARYVNTESEDTVGYYNPLSSITNVTSPYLRMAVTNHNTYRYIHIFVDAKQVVKESINKVIYSTDFMDYFLFDIDYTGDQLAEFMVFYRKPGSDKFYQIEKRLMDTAPTDKPFCYYQYKDEDTITISFSTMHRYFKPAFNSELRFEIFTSMGANGNFEYKGNNVKINLKSDKYDYRDVIMLAESLSDSVGGVDKKTYDDIKLETAYLASTCDNISTTIDLNKYFEYIQASSKMLFVKKRDDILERLFTCYVLMRDWKNNIIPTNTPDLRVEFDHFDTFVEASKRYIIKAGNTFVYDKDNKKLVSKYTDKKNPPNPNDYIYTNPYLMVISKSPYIVTYYLNSLNVDIFTQYEYINDSAFYSFLVNKMNIQRDAVNGDDEYTLSVVIKQNTAIEMKKLIETDEKGKFTLDKKTLVLKGIIYDVNDTSKISHYFNFNITGLSEDGNLIAEAKIKTDDYISVENGLRTIDSIIYTRKTELEKDLLIQASDMKIGIVAFFKDKELPKMYDEIHDLIPGMEDYMVTNKYLLINKVNLINNMNDVMKSTILLNKIKDGNGINTSSIYNYTVKEFPLVKYEYLKNKYYTMDFFKKIYDNRIILRNALQKLDNNFNLDFKFYNTYGRSSYFYVNRNSKDILDNINIIIRLTVNLNPNKMLDEDLKYEIKMEIKDYLESTNDSNNLYISNLITHLENKYRDIISVQFENINSYATDTQAIEKDFPIDNINKNKLVRYFIPEYINLDKSYQYDTVKDNIIIKFI